MISFRTLLHYLLGFITSIGKREQQNKCFSLLSIDQEASSLISIAKSFVVVNILDEESKSPQIDSKFQRLLLIRLLQLEGLGSGQQSAFPIM
jgi:hypothetical protein